MGIVCAQFNEFIVSKLLSGCEDVLLRHGVQLDEHRRGLGSRRF